MGWEGSAREGGNWQVQAVAGGREGMGNGECRMRNAECGMRNWGRGRGREELPGWVCHDGWDSGRSGRRMEFPCRHLATLAGPSARQRRTRTRRENGGRTKDCKDSKDSSDVRGCEDCDDIKDCKDAGLTCRGPSALCCKQPPVLATYCAGCPGCGTGG